MKKVIFSAAALMLASAFSFAGTPETKTEAKAKPEVKTSSTVYHYTSESTAPGAFANTANWSEGPSDNPTCGSYNNKPCEITADDAADLSSMLNGQSNSNVLLITDRNRQ
ncbi:hypothetical protein [Sphingobacterium sp. UGAL515B_05]|uniref:hypothetical protein n=1 Tax=Sphingobacterium sp. UGAL515B_05 TaxID=2986767 RepID=UPI002953ADA3|nr:hypothetical protein [Sphingobacterium sp. UGAL515B_05]WON93786.1 hypothetical protein OK025_21370 [Sphingobacterium sp. UGAL515B_05]